MYLLKNCNGIRPTLTTDTQTESLTNEVCNREGMVTRRENIDYELISAAEVEEVLNQPGIQFVSSHLIPNQLQNEPGANTIFSEETNASDLAPPIETVNNEQERGGRDPPEMGSVDISPMAFRNAGGSSSMKARNVWLGVAVGAAVGLWSVLMGDLNRRVSTSNN